MRDKDVALGANRVRGRVRSFLVAPDGKRRPLSAWEKNLVLKSWGGIAARLFASGDSAYKLGVMYIEYENSGSLGDSPAYDREAAAGIDYYNSLASNLSRDYLRIPIVAATVDSSDEDEFPAGNLITFFALTEGAEGVHGKPFTFADSSYVIGGALVAAPVDSDPTRDIVFSRFYFDEAIPKAETHQIGIEWELQLQ